MVAIDGDVDAANTVLIALRNVVYQVQLARFFQELRFRLEELVISAQRY